MCICVYREDERMSDEQATQYDKDELITLADAARHFGYHPNYFAQLAQQGRINAKKYGPVWMTTLADVEDYLSNRRKRGMYRDIDLD